jgi:Fe2+ or Zn2+ uptake regulation protein
MADDATTPTETQGPTFYSIEQLSDSTEVLSAAATLYAQRSVFPAVGPGRAQTPLPTGKGISDGAAILEKINSGDLEQLTPEQKVQLTGWAIDVAEFSASNALGSYLSDVVNRDTASPDIKNSFQLIQNAYSISEASQENNTSWFAPNPDYILGDITQGLVVGAEEGSKDILDLLPRILGAPVDLVNEGLTKIGFGSNYPALGSAMLTDAKNYYVHGVNAVIPDVVLEGYSDYLQTPYENPGVGATSEFVGSLAPDALLVGGGLALKGSKMTMAATSATQSIKTTATAGAAVLAMDSVAIADEVIPMIWDPTEFAQGSTTQTIQAGQTEGNETMVKMTAEEAALFEMLEKRVFSKPTPDALSASTVHELLLSGPQKSLLESAYAAIDGLKASGQIHPLRQGELSEFQAALYGFETQTAANGQALRIDGNGLVSEAAVTVAPVTTTPSKTPVTTPPAASGTTTPTTTTVTTTPAVPLTPEQELQAGQTEGNETMVKMTAEEAALFEMLEKRVFSKPTPDALSASTVHELLLSGPQKSLLESAYAAIDGLKASGQIHPLRQGELSEFQAALYGFETQTAANGQALRIDGNGLVSEAAVTNDADKEKDDAPKDDGPKVDPKDKVKDEPKLTPLQEAQAGLKNSLALANTRFDGVNNIIDASILDANKVINSTEATDSIKQETQVALAELTAGKTEWGNAWDVKKTDIQAAIDGTDTAKINLLIAELKAGDTVPYEFTTDSNIIITAQAKIEDLHETVFPGLLTRAAQVTQYAVDRGWLAQGTSTSLVSDTVKNGGLFLTGAFKEVGGQAIDLFKDLNKNDGALGEWGPVAMQLAGALGIGLLLKNTLLDSTLGKVPFIGGLLSAGAAIFAALKYGTGITASVQEYFTGERTSIQQQGGAATLARLNNMTSTTVDDTKETKIVVDPAKPLTETEIVAAAQKALEQNANTEIVAQTGYGSGHVDYRLLQAVAAQKSGAGHTANGLNDNDPEAEIQAYTVHHGFQITGTDSIKVAIGGNTPTPVPDNNNIPTPEEAELQRMVP